MDGVLQPSAVAYIALAGAVFLLLLISAFFSGSEAAFLSFNRHRLRYLVESGDRRARLVARIMYQVDTFLATILVGNNLVNTLAAVLAGVGVQWMLADSPLGIPVATVVMTGLLLVFSEITPKVIATVNHEKWSKSAARTIIVLTVVLKPVIVVANAISGILLKALGTDPHSIARGLTRDELRFLITETQQHGALLGTEEQMLGRVLEFPDLTARDLMIPRPDVDALDIEKQADVLTREVIESGKSRLPVYKDSIDSVQGVLYAKDLLAALQRGEEPNINKIIRPAYFIPEHKRVADLLREFQRRRVHIAVVVDDFGGTAGVVTLEDLIEEIVGEIVDEHDEENDVPKRLPDGAWELPAMLRVEQADALLGTSLPAQDSETLGGFVMEHLGHLPVTGETFEVQGYAFTVSEIQGRRVTRVTAEAATHGHHDTPET
jgi:putative hemolysin